MSFLSIERLINKHSWEVIHTDADWDTKWAWCDFWAFFLNCWNFVDPLKKILESVFYWRTPEKNFWRPFFFGEHLRLCPWPRAFLSLASRGSVLGRAVLGLGFFFVSLALSLASSLVSSTPPLIIGTKMVFFSQLKLCQQKIVTFSKHNHILKC